MNRQGKTGELRGRRRRRRALAAGLVTATVAGGSIVIAVNGPLPPRTDAAYRPLSTGHGRGMSQFGALEQAASGATAERILGTYYPGAVSATVGPATVRVRLTVYDGQTLDVYSDAGLAVAGRRVVRGQVAHLTPTPEGADVTVTSGCTGEVLWRGSTDDPRAYPVDPGPDRPATEHLKVCDGGTFRGVLGVVLENGAARTVNELDVEDYLLGVVPAEMQANWADRGGAEALRAQAVAARSYALAEHRYAYAQTCDTTDCQVYPGTEKEDPRATSAVRTTTGQVLLRNGRILRTEYSSAPGGGSPIDIDTLEVGPTLAELAPSPARPPAAPDVTSAVAATYAVTGGPAGPLGEPLGQESPLPGRAGTFRLFQGGAIVATPGLGARVVDVATLLRIAPRALAARPGGTIQPGTAATPTPPPLPQYLPEDPWTTKPLPLPAPPLPAPVPSAAGPEADAPSDAPAESGEPAVSSPPAPPGAVEPMIIESVGE
ncbi:SpoIID/LytB domain-containing protein [Nocardia transvalensis]|nr:SpoIID/LytB domain-containing protein [Nocardia transvalensis]